MSEKIILESLASDLKRVSLGLHRGSIQMANKFKEEALKRSTEVNPKNVKPYIVDLLSRMKKDLSHEDQLKVAEDALMYSTLFQNYTQKLITPT